MTPEQMQHALSHCEFFKELDPPSIEKISRICTPESYEVGQALFHQGDLDEHLYVIAEGHAVLQRSVDLRTRRGTVVIDTLGKGRVLGAWSTILGESHILMSSAIAQKPLVTVRISGVRLRQLMKDDALIGRKVLEQLCFLLRNRISAAYGAMDNI